MKTLLRKLLARKSSPKRRPEPRRVLPQVEGLEERQLLTVTWGGGSVLPNVEATPVFYGSGWHANAQTEGDNAYMTAFLQDIVNSPYMDMLGNAGYGVGRGSADGATFVSDGQSEPDYLPTSQILTDVSIRYTLEGWINSDAQFARGPFGFGGLQPDENRLYVIFVEPGVEVSLPSGSGTLTSGNEAGVEHFGAYHSSFIGTDNSGNAVNIRYAVVPYHDGATNSKNSWLSTRDDMTMATSHELAEAVTDPDSTISAYLDYSTGNEIGDIVNQEVVYQHGYAVQREADPNNQAMTPSDATPQRAVTFVVQAASYAVGTGGSYVTTNQLFERTPDGNLYAVIGRDGNYVYGVRSISDQGIDNYGKAMIDVVTNAGAALEYHDGGTWLPLISGVKDAKAGQGVSYVLLNSGALWEWTDGSPATGGSAVPAHWTKINDNVSAIDAGTDARGVNTVAEIWFGQAWTFSDSTGWHFIANGVAQASAGRSGTVDFVNASGNVFWWNEGAGPAAQIGSNATKVTTGYNTDGSDVIDILFRNGTVWDYRSNGLWKQLDYNVRDLTKARAGVVDTMSNAGNAWEFPTADYYFLVLGATRNRFSSTWTMAMA